MAFDLHFFGLNMCPIVIALDWTSLIIFWKYLRELPKREKSSANGRVITSPEVKAFILHSHDIGEEGLEGHEEDDGAQWVPLEDTSEEIKPLTSPFLCHNSS